jgi:hypothetical protein
MAPNPIPLEASKQHRAAFIGVFNKHHTLKEDTDSIHDVECAGDLPDDVTLQRIVAAYEGVQVWLLNEDGPLQAFYEEGEEWGDTGDYEYVAREIAQRLD